jgi:hypothetical protein
MGNHLQSALNSIHANSSGSHPMQQYSHAIQDLKIAFHAAGGTKIVAPQPLQGFVT